MQYVTILILIDGFLQYEYIEKETCGYIIVTILILIDGFLQCVKMTWSKEDLIVTILILIDGFLQYKLMSM